MKKRFVTTLIALIACIACALGLAACGDNQNPATEITYEVAGKTYLFESGTIVNGAEEDAKEMAETQLNLLYAGSTLSFGNDVDFTMTVKTTVVHGTYTKNGNAVTMTADDNTQSGTVSDGKIVLLFENAGMQANLTYLLQT